MTLLQAKWTEAEIPPVALALIGQVKNAAFRVHRALGAGFRESVYQRCLAHALSLDGVPFEEHVPLRVEFEGLSIENAGQPDFIVGDRIIVEIKAVESAHPLHAAQLINYLKASGLPAGLLINFNVRYLRHGMDKYVHPSLLERMAQR